MGGGRAGAVGMSELCPKNSKRFGVKTARGENLSETDWRVWKKNEGV